MELKEEIGMRLNIAKRERDKYTTDNLVTDLQNYFLDNDDETTEVKKSTIDSHLSGRNMPSIEYLVAYSKIFGKPLDWIIKGENGNEKIEVQVNELHNKTPESVFKALVFLLDNLNFVLDDVEYSKALGETDSIGYGYTTTYTSILFPNDIVNELILRYEDSHSSGLIEQIKETFNSDCSDLFISKILLDKNGSIQYKLEKGEIMPLT